MNSQFAASFTTFQQLSLFAIKRNQLQDAKHVIYDSQSSQILKKQMKNRGDLNYNVILNFFMAVIMKYFPDNPGIMCELINIIFYNTPS